MIGAWIRKVGFWSLDFMKGSPVRKKYRILSSIREGRKKSNALNDLLQYAISTVPAYSHITSPRIESFPVVNKSIYRQNYESYRSSKFLDETKLHAAYTSGSTGIPFKALQNNEKLQWHQAGLIAINENIGWDLGARFMFMRVWDLAHSSSRFSQFLSNTIPVDVVGFSDERCEEIRQKLLRDKSLKMIIGYASALEKLSNYILTKKESPSDYGINLIIADSENLSKDAENAIKKAFGCPLYNRYGNNENGILALAGPDSEEFRVNFPEYYIEILDVDSDIPVKEGEMGRIVITDLYNYAFPFIRYDTGDLGIAGRVTDDGCVVISKLLGRVSSSLFATDNSLITETTVTAHFEDMPNLGRFQIIQTGNKEYEFLIESTSPEFDGSILSRMKKCMGDDAVVLIKHVKCVNQGKNGKIPVTINKIK